MSKAKGRKHRLKAADATTIVRELHGAKIHEKRHHVCMIEYGNGSSRIFTHAPYAGLVKVVEPDGTVWKRAPLENLWVTDGGAQFKGRIEVSRSGVVSFVEENGDRRVFTPSGEELHPLSYNQLDTVFLKTLYIGDTNSDGIMSRQELEASIQSTGLVGKDAQLLALLRLSYDHLTLMTTLVDNQWHTALTQLREKLFTWGKGGIRLQDLEGVKKLIKETAEQGEAIIALVQEWGSSLSTSSNSIISQQEIRKALDEKPTGSAERLFWRYMLTAFHEISQSDAKVSISDLKLHALCMERRARYLSAAFDLVLGTSGGRVARTNRSLYAAIDNPLAAIKPQAIHQGFIGDCMFLAMIASMAAVNPEVIERSILDHGDGTYTVVFPAAPGEPIAVPALTEAELTLYIGGCPLGLWPAVLEKAGSIYCSRKLWRRLRKEKPYQVLPTFWKSELPSENATGPGGIDLFGQTMLIGLSSKPSDEIVRLIAEALAAKNAVIMCRLLPEKEIGETGQSSTVFGAAASSVYPNHAYAVVAVDEARQVVELYDPWGNDGGTPERSEPGTLTLPFARIAETMSRMYITRLSVPNRE